MPWISSKAPDDGWIDRIVTEGHTELIDREIVFAEQKKLIHGLFHKVIHQPIVVVHFEVILSHDHHQIAVGIQFLDIE